jgi:thiol-disulfide isomerase/thioredoxin
MGLLRRAAIACALLLPLCFAQSRARAEAVLLDFQTDWCGYCRVMEPVVRELAAEGYQVRAINGDHEPELVRQFRIEGYPTFVVLGDGREVGRASGQVSKTQLYSLLEKAGGSARKTAGARIRGQSPDGPAGAYPSGQRLASTQTSSGRDSAGWESAGALPAAATTNAADVTQRLIAASVRLRIEDDHGQSVGSGTVIDAREGEALILTCGHVFREFKEGGQILVDFFGAHAPQKVPGVLVSYDLNSDVGLVRVTSEHPFVAALVAPPGSVCRAGDSVTSVGCDHGADATPRVTNIVSVDRYSHAPNLQVAFEPVQGRSGGGLFNRDGQLVGVCNAADATDRQGLFAALGAVYTELDRTNLSFVYRPESAVPVALVTTAPVDTKLVAEPSPAAESLFVASNRLSSEEQALINELRQARGAEVICLVRALDAPQTKSRVFEINRASAAFWRELANVNSSVPEHRLTSLEDPMPLAHWSAQRTVVAATPLKANNGYRSAESRVWPPRVRQ